MTTKKELPADLDNLIAGLRIENINLKLAAKQAEALLREAEQNIWHPNVVKGADTLAPRINAFLASQQRERNQCDGCQAGIPALDGAHRMGRPGGYPDLMSCQKERYEHPEQAEGAQGELDTLEAILDDVCGKEGAPPVDTPIYNISLNEIAEAFTRLQARAALAQPSLCVHDKMRDARKAAIVGLRSLGFEDLLERATKNAQPSPEVPYADGIAADLERSDWTPEEALRWYAQGNHFDVVGRRTRIIDTGAIASNALKHLSLPYLEMKGDAELTELREATAQPSPELDQLYNMLGVTDQVQAGERLGFLVGQSIMVPKLEADLAFLVSALNDCSGVAMQRGDQYLCDAIDNNGTPYQSEALGEALEWDITRGLLPVAQAGQMPEGMRLVPFNPTEEQWGGLARAIVFWMRSYPSNKHTPATLVEFITSLGHAVPEWMGDESELRATDHVISKGTIAVLIYKAMLAAAPAQGDGE